MQEDERKLMISIAEAVKHLTERVISLEKGKEKDVAKIIPVNGVPFNAGSFLNTISKIEHRHQGNEFKMDITFDPTVSISSPQRMEMSVEFLKEFESVLRKYRVTKLDGTYNFIAI